MIQFTDTGPLGNHGGESRFPLSCNNGRSGGRTTLSKNNNNNKFIVFNMAGRSRGRGGNHAPNEDITSPSAVVLVLVARANDPCDSVRLGVELANTAPTALQVAFCWKAASPQLRLYTNYQRSYLPPQRSTAPCLLLGAASRLQPQPMLAPPPSAAPLPQTQPPAPP